ncbi:MAG: sphingosine kinase, partial [Thermoanaerobaculum sp.]
GQELFSGPALLVAVANGTSFGKGMRIAPLARPNDGLLDVVVVEAVRGWQLVRRLPLVYLGRHLRLPQVRFARGKEFRLSVADPLPPFDVDGECVPSGPAGFSVMPGALQVAHARTCGC